MDLISSMKFGCVEDAFGLFHGVEVSGNQITAQSQRTNKEGSGFSAHHSGKGWNRD